MNNEMYREAFEYALNEILKEYKAANKEREFVFNFNMNYEGDDNDTITVSVANQFLLQMMQKKGSFEIVQNKLREITNLNNLIIKTVINENIETKTVEEKKEPKISEVIKQDEEEIIQTSKPIKKHPLLREDFTFDTFIPGENSNFAYNGSLAVAKNPGKEYNPILLYGGSGLGKTHLMQAIGNYIYNNGGEKLKICYVSAETFTNEFTSSIQRQKTNEFKSKYRNLDVLLLDDIHFLSEKEATQEELFYTFNALHEKKAQMVFTCDRPIKEIKHMADRLVSRLTNGLAIDITIPNYETRCAILQKKMEQKEKNLSPEIIEYIAKSVETNVRELEASLNKVIGYADLTGKNPTLDVVKNLLKDLINSRNAISLEVIQKVIADDYQITVADLKGKKRDKKYVLPRQVAIYIARELTEISYTELGNEFGGKDHTTIMHAYEKISEKIKVDSTLEGKIQLFIKEIKDYKE